MPYSVCDKAYIMTFNEELIESIRKYSVLDDSTHILDYRDTKRREYLD